MTPIDLNQARHEICMIGRRLYDKGFVSANDGNLTIRLDEERVLCTPTLRSKGFLKPEDLVIIDFEGKKIDGELNRSSEALLHLEVYRQRPDIRCVVHCHPPHATAFAIAREPIPQGVLPEVEVFLGEVPTAHYETPGTKVFAETIRDYVQNAKVIVLSNHGTLSYDTNLEHAFWWTEILDSYCRVLMLTRQLGHIEYLPPEKQRELLASKSDWGLEDPRYANDRADWKLQDATLYSDQREKARLKRRAFPKQ